MHGAVIKGLWRVMAAADTSFLLDFQATDEDIAALREWLSGLNYTAGRAPAGGKKLLEDLKFLQRQFDANEEYGFAINKNNLKSAIGRWDADTIALIEKKFKVQIPEEKLVDITSLNATIEMTRSTLEGK